MLISRIGKEKSISRMILRMSSSPRSRQFTGMTFVSYRSVSSAASFCTSGRVGSTVFMITTNGFPSSLSSRITRSSHSSYSARGMSEIEPSVVMTRPIVEWSVMTFCVPISAAILKGISSSNHEVMTIRGCSFSIYPSELGTI